MSRASVSDELVLGAEPRVHLLPPEVAAGRRGKAMRRNLGVSVVGVVILALLGVAGSSWLAIQSQEKLASAQAHTIDLLAEQSKYVEARNVQDEVDLALSARQLGASTEIDWKDYLGKVRAILPTDVSIDAVTVEAASPLALYDQATVPLQGARVATLTLDLTSTNLPEAPVWLKGLKELPGYADGTPGTITQTDLGTYQVNLVLHINDGAYSQRFADVKEK
ncbi:hypothetical protein E3T24_03240 [Cryobacterium sp. TmT2-59]|uniref:hypothetical protein n=1 Tax=Cryobacterium sp. TmT2-59 TaxID=1259264 RepID=UPI001069B002|nr:hypothetical protein [Cryobacterium sp. TmT2-59]TFC88165.1 hypothetical protein E3T24_03240 [Cryobacterium sp. TmT2-59]